jgi:hypothetical protein
MLNYVLNVPQIKENTSDKKQELYRYIFKTLFSSGFETHFTENLQKLLMCVYEANEDIVNMRFHYDLPQLKWFTLRSEHMLGLLGYALIQFGKYSHHETQFYQFDRFVCNVLECMSAVPNMKIEQEGCISPLTAFILTTSKLEDDDSYYGDDSDDDDDDEETIQGKLDLFKKLIEKGCNVNSMCLLTNDQDLNEVKQKLQVPDVLFISLLANNEKYVETLLPYWWGPPLSLLLLCTDFQEIYFWQPILMKYGSVPRGMSLCHELHTHLMEFEHFYTYDGDIDEQWQQHLQQNSE